MMKCVNSECGSELVEGTIVCPRCQQQQPVAEFAWAANLAPSTVGGEVLDLPHVPPPNGQNSGHNGDGQGKREHGQDDPLFGDAAHGSAPAAPERARELVRRARDLTAQYHRTFDEATKQRKSDEERAEEKRKRAELEFNKIKVEIEGKLGQEKTNLDVLYAQHKSMADQAGDHLRAQSESGALALADGSAHDYRVSRSSNPFEEGRQHTLKAQELLKELVNTKKPEIPFIPNNQLAALGIVLLSAFAAVAIGLALESVGAGVFVFVGVYVVLLILVYRLASAQIRQRYEAWLEEKQRAAACLTHHQQRVEQTYREDFTAAEASYGRSKREYEQTLTTARASYTDRLKSFRSTFAPKVRETHEACALLKSDTKFSGAEWSEPVWENWAPAPVSAQAARIGLLRTAPVQMAPELSDVNLSFTLPAMLPVIGGRGLVVKAEGEKKGRAVECLQSLMFRLLATIPPGKVRFTLIDPVGLGQNVAAFMPLGDHDESLIQSRAWTEPQHIEEQLAKLTEHMETVIQKYLRSDYASIEEYNRQAGEVAEPYRVLVVLDFPVNFSETAARRLVSIARNGPRCGVYTLVVGDTSKPLPYGFSVADLEQTAEVVTWDDGRFVWRDSDYSPCLLEPDQPPGKLGHTLIDQVGRMAVEAMKVQVPYGKLLELAKLTKDGRWRGTTEKLLQVPLGPTGARKLQYLTFGQGTAHHAVVIGRTGSGKSNLMHVIVTTLALTYSPDEVQLYLIDFKQGVEFKAYAEAALPHAKVIAIESEREFGLSVLQGLDAELHQRGETFRGLGVNNITEYRAKSGKRLPRILLLVDEFQEFFTEEDQIARQASMILDRLVRQGRYAGIHVMLGSQNLAASRSLPHSTIGQMGIRIALQCSDSDARQIMADDNPAARLLSRPGEAIYNAASGLVEGNNFFQVALFTEEDRLRRLVEVSRLAGEQTAAPAAPLIFEGNQPARIEGCQPLSQLAAAGEWPTGAKAYEAWVGEPIAIRPPTSIRFRRQGGSHLLVVTRDEEEGVGVLASAVLSLAAQAHPAAAKFFIVDLSTVDSSWSGLAKELSDLLPHEVQVLGRRDLPPLLQQLDALRKERLESASAGGESIFLVIQGLHRARELRAEDGRAGYGFGRGEERAPSAPELFAALLREGPEVGIHALAWCDSYSNTARVVDRRTLGEFGFRIAAAMSNDDSMHLIDEPAAAKLDKPHRAILFEEERPGYLEKFRPYAIPEGEWLRQYARALRARVSRAQAV